MYTIQHSILIRQPAPQVFAYVSHYPNDIHWRAGVVTMTQDAPATTVGTHSHEVLHFMGQNYETMAVVTEVVPDYKIAFRSTQAQFPVQGWRATEAVADGTQFTYSLTLEPTGFMALAAPLLTNVMARQVRFDLRTLKVLLEREAVVR